MIKKELGMGQYTKIGGIKAIVGRTRKWVNVVLDLTKTTLKHFWREERWNHWKWHICSHIPILYESISTNNHVFLAS